MRLKEKKDRNFERKKLKKMAREEEAESSKMNTGEL